MESEKHNSKRVIWAYDPFEKGIQCDSETIADLGSWLGEGVVEPVYLCPPPSDGKVQEATIHRMIVDQFKQWPVKVSSVTVISSGHSSVRFQAKSLADYATKQRADLIVVTSHGRKGLQRMMFGSFAEALLKVTKTPLLFMNHEKRPSGATFQRALFATDFSKENEKAYSDYLAVAMPASELLIYHELNFSRELLVNGMYGAMGVPAVTMGDFTEEQAEWARHESEKWLHLASRQGVKAKALLQNGYDFSTSILEAAIENKAGLVVMSAHSSAYEALLLGSHSRQVFRSGKLPVWIYGPRCFEKTTGGRILLKKSP